MDGRTPPTAANGEYTVCFIDEQPHPACTGLLWIINSDDGDEQICAVGNGIQPQFLPALRSGKSMSPTLSTSGTQKQSARVREITVDMLCSQ